DATCLLGDDSGEPSFALERGWRCAKHFFTITSGIPSPAAAKWRRHFANPSPCLIVVYGKRSSSYTPPICGEKRRRFFRIAGISLQPLTNCAEMPYSRWRDALPWKLAHAETPSFCHGCDGRARSSRPSPPFYLERANRLEAR